MPTTFDPASSLYTHQVVIDFTADGTAFSLLDKWHEKHAKGTAVRIDGRKGMSEQLAILNPQANKKSPNGKTNIGFVKIYIDAHAYAGSDDIFGNPRDKHFKKKSVEDLAKQLGEFLKKNQIEDKAVINLIACGGGHEAGEKKSFAEKLHQEMKKQSSNIPIVARKGVVDVNTRNGKKETIGSELPYAEACKLANSFLGFFNGYSKSKQPKSKWIFHSDETNPDKIKISDTYERSWARSVFKTLDWEMYITKHPGKKALLEQWKTDFKGKTDEYIINVLKQALDNSTSPLHARSGFSGLFHNSAKSAIARLIESGEKSLRIYTARQ